MYINSVFHPISPEFYLYACKLSLSSDQSRNSTGMHTDSVLSYKARILSGGDLCNGKYFRV